MEENKPVSTSPVDDWDDIDLSDVVDNDAEDDAAPAAEQERAADTEAETAANHSEGEAEAEPTETSTEAKKSEEADHSFTLKYMGEEKAYSREDTITLAQKGLDYDRMKDKLAEANKTAESNAEAADLVKFLAEGMGITPQEFILNARAGAVSKKEGISLEEAKSRIQMDAREKNLAAREKALEQKQEGEKAEEAKKQQRQQQFIDFFRQRPDVKAEDIPKEVYQQMGDGVTLLAAYAMYENTKLKTELEAAKQNAENRERSVGSASTSGKHQTVDEFDAAWYDGT